MSESQRKWFFFFCCSTYAHVVARAAWLDVYFLGENLLPTQAHDTIDFSAPFLSHLLALHPHRRQGRGGSETQEMENDGKWRKKKLLYTRERNFVLHRAQDFIPFWSLSSFMCTQKTSVAAGNEKENFQIFQTSHILHGLISNISKAGASSSSSATPPNCLIA